MAKLGDKSRIKFATKLVDGVTNEDFGIKTDTADVTTKDSVGWTEIFPVNKNGELALSIVFETKPGGSPTKAYLKDFIDAQIAGTLTAWEYALSDTTGDMKFTGNLYVTGVSIKSKVKDVVTADVTFAPTGTITVGTV